MIEGIEVVDINEVKRLKDAVGNLVLVLETLEEIGNSPGVICKYQIISSA